MKVVIVKQHPVPSLRVGKELNVPEDTAKRLIAEGYAELAEGETTTEEPAQKTETVAEKPKAATKKTGRKAVTSKNIE